MIDLLTLKNSSFARSTYIQSFSTTQNDVFKVKSPEYESCPPFCCAFGKPVLSFNPLCHSFILGRRRDTKFLAVADEMGTLNFLDFAADYLENGIRRLSYSSY